MSESWRNIFSFSFLWVFFTAFNILSSIAPALELARWVRYIVVTWRSWLQQFWEFIFQIINLKIYVWVPDFSTFVCLYIGVMASTYLSPDLAGRLKYLRRIEKDMRFTINTQITKSTSNLSDVAIKLQRAAHSVKEEPTIANIRNLRQAVLTYVHERRVILENGGELADSLNLKGKEVSAETISTIDKLIEYAQANERYAYKTTTLEVFSSDADEIAIHVVVSLILASALTLTVVSDGAFLLEYAVVIYFAIPLMYHFKAMRYLSASGMLFNLRSIQIVGTFVLLVAINFIALYAEKITEYSKAPSV